jgi:hypothetical protein
MRSTLLKRSHFPEELTGKIHLTQYYAVATPAEALTAVN